jgi:hypothetical protein
MNFESARQALFNLVEEANELLMPVPSMAAADGHAAGYVQGCEQRGDPVSFVIVRLACRHVGGQRQNWLGTIQRLHLTFSSTHSTFRLRTARWCARVDSCTTPPYLVPFRQTAGPWTLAPDESPFAPGIEERIAAYQQKSKVAATAVPTNPTGTISPPGASNRAERPFQPTPIRSGLTFQTEPEPSPPLPCNGGWPRPQPTAARRFRSAHPFLACA